MKWRTCKNLTVHIVKKEKKKKKLKRALSTKLKSYTWMEFLKREMIISFLFFLISLLKKYGSSSDYIWSVTAL